MYDTRSTDTLLRAQLNVWMLVQELKERHRQVMQNMLMDMLRALATPNMDIRKKTLDIALDLINQHNIDEVRPQRNSAKTSL